MKKILQLGIRFPKLTLAAVIIFTLVCALQIPKIRIDTDPENMLSEKEFVRHFHHEIKKEFSLYDFIVLGIVNEQNPDGVFNTETLGKIHELTQKIKTIPGVIAYELISPSTKDNIRQAGLGTVQFEWLMAQPPKTAQEARSIREEAKDNPMLDGTIVSEDGRAICLFVPIQQKNLSYKISEDIRQLIRDQSGPESYYITGLPVAEDTFGVEMFKQMGLSAPVAGLIIFLLLWFFFKKISLIASPMILAIMTVLSTMGLLIGAGYTVHIMSSMIPIFLMPISVVDSVHILSEFFDRYQKIKNKKKTIEEVMNHLFTPMLYTSLTTAAGFASLAFTPIPPVQIFGLFVALGVFIAWILTMIFIPAYVMLLNEKSLEKFGQKSVHKDDYAKKSFLHSLRNFSSLRWKTVLSITFAVLAVSAFGISKIKINDNPVKWFAKNHRIRVADEVLNRHFAGTYTAYLVLEATNKTAEIFKQPEMLAYVEKIQLFLKSPDSQVGKSTSLADVVKKIHYELMDGDKSFNRIPSTPQAVAQCLISYENSHKPDDLWHLVTPDYSKLNIWIQLKSGDNKDMDRVARSVHQFLRLNEPPFEVTAHWAGLTYINTVWQNKMVFGMLKSLLGSFIMVFFMMAFLFRSPLWGLLSMVPLTVTITLIYGLIGLMGKEYDMPVAVLSSLTLGLSIDFAIHFLERTRSIQKKTNNWKKTLEEMFEEPARAISKNALVISIGFLPLLLSNLVPYKTVGFFLAAIMAVSSLTTLIILPAIISALQNKFFKNYSPTKRRPQ